MHSRQKLTSNTGSHSVSDSLCLCHVVCLHSSLGPKCAACYHTCQDGCLKHSSDSRLFMLWTAVFFFYHIHKFFCFCRNHGLIWKTNILNIISSWFLIMYASVEYLCRFYCIRIFDFINCWWVSYKIIELDLGVGQNLQDFLKWP